MHATLVEFGYSSAGRKVVRLWQSLLKVTLVEGVGLIASSSLLTAFVRAVVCPWSPI